MEREELVAVTDKLFHASIVEGVVLDAKWALDAKRYRAAAILTYCGIDAIASLMRDPGKLQVDRNDFIAWCDRYLDFRSKESPTGIELYGARCGLLHANMAESALSSAGKARLIGYVDNANESVLKDDQIKDLILLSTRHLVGIFAEGVLSSWRKIKQMPELLPVVRERLEKLVRSYDIG